MNKMTWLNRTLGLVLVLGMLLSSVPETLVQHLGRSLETGIAHAAPFVTATKHDLLLVDNDGDGIADPGEDGFFRSTDEIEEPDAELHIRGGEVAEPHGEEMKGVDHHTS